ncbi:MAG: hypothetical protein EZS28_003922 [Streblomastix strix]|uniref:Uncharacterized protein n=1 Tax=Streblomastix strix TaxID=222440 RepID=A0A5J4X0G3_9EUKA|nr:MAG: hypothetical protein EZS28_003922 [Streblomastix strix]
MGLTSMNVIPGLECNEIEGSLQTTQSTHASKTFTKKIVGFKKGMEPKIIFAQQNKFTSFEGMPQLVNLEQIFLDNNQIINFVGIPYLKNLHILTLENNNITSFCGAELLPNLEQLNLKGNPITEYIPEDAHEQSDKAYRVMAFIAFGSNKLKRIDNEILSLCERDDGERIMQYVQDNIRQGYLLRHIYNEPLNSLERAKGNKIDPQFEVSGYVDLLWKKDSIKELKVMKKHPYHIRGKMDRISPFVVPGKWTEQSLLKEQKERQIKQKCKQQKERLSGWEGNEEIIQDENITKQDDPNNTIVQIKDDDQLENEEIQRNKERNEFNDDYEQTQHIYVAEEDLHDTDILFLKKMRDVMDATKQLLTIEDDIFKQEQDNEQNKSTEIKEIKHLRGLQGKLCAHPAVFDALGINLIRLTDEKYNRIFINIINRLGFEYC